MSNAVESPLRETAPNAAKPRSESAPRRLLIIDDEPPLLDLLKLYFEENGFHVSLAVDSTRGLELLKNETPELVILDIILAGEDGLKLLPRIKELRPETKVVMVTGMGYPPDLLQEALQRGADGYVAKGSAMLFDLLRTVRGLLTQES